MPLLVKKRMYQQPSSNTQAFVMFPSKPFELLFRCLSSGVSQHSPLHHRIAGSCRLGGHRLLYINYFTFCLKCLFSAFFSLPRWSLLGIFLCPASLCAQIIIACGLQQHCHKRVRLSAGSALHISCALYVLCLHPTEVII